MHYRTVFEQLLKPISRREFEESVRRCEADRGTRRLDTWTWFGALLFGQLTGRESLRSIERPFSIAVRSFRSAGMSPVHRSTMAEANHQRPLEPLMDTYKRLMAQARAMAPCNRLKVQEHVVLMDSSVIELYRKVNPWAEFRRGTSAVKLHATISLNGSLPGFFVVTPALRHDLPVARRYFRFPKGSTVIVDRGYWDARWLQTLTEQGVGFVTRQRKNNRFRATETHSVAPESGVIRDQTVRQRGSHGRSAYSGDLRRIRFRDPKTGKNLIFLTNRFDIDAATIAALYKARWDIELFFKAIKQNLKIRRFLGRTHRAVEVQILVALIAYLLLQIARLASKTRLSVTVAIETLRGLALHREPLASLLGHPAPRDLPDLASPEVAYAN